MQTITTIGFDIAKSVFQVYGVDAGGQVIIRGQLKRRHVLAFFQKLPPCLVGIEACASSHHWSRELQAVPVANQIRTYWWCSPPRTGRQRMLPARSTARETGASFSKDRCVRTSL